MISKSSLSSVVTLQKQLLTLDFSEYVQSSYIHTT